MTVRRSKKGIFDVSELLEQPTDELAPDHPRTEVHFGSHDDGATAETGPSLDSVGELDTTMPTAIEDTALRPMADLPDFDWGPRWSEVSGTSPEELEGRTDRGYLFEKLIASGTFSHVYRARRLTTGEPFAIKVLRTHLGDSPALRRRFLREGKALATIDHERIVRTFEVGELQNGCPFQVMSLVRGENLATVMRRVGPLEPEFVRLVALQVSSGLQALHRVGLVHRDLKPSNIMLVESPHPPAVMLIDLGLARWLEPDEQTRLTRAQQVLGSPAYMAPEQIDAPSEAGPAADIYALGISMYEMLAGRRPFDGPDESAVLYGHLELPPPPLATDARLGRIVSSMLAKDPSRRPTLQAVARGLERAGRAHQPPLHLPIALASIVALAALGVWVTPSERAAPPPPSREPPLAPRPPEVRAEPMRQAQNEPAPSASGSNTPSPPEVVGSNGPSPAAPELEPATRRTPNPRRARASSRGGERAQEEEISETQGESTESSLTEVEPAESEDLVRSAEVSAKQSRDERMQRVLGLLQLMADAAPEELPPFERRYLQLRKQLRQPGIDLAGTDEALEALELELKTRLGR